MELPVIVIIGYLALALGVFHLFARHLIPSALFMFQPMKEKWGATKGYIIHFIAYTVIPLVFGIRVVGKHLGWF